MVYMPGEEIHSSLNELVKAILSARWRVWTSAAELRFASIRANAHQFDGIQFLLREARKRSELLKIRPMGRTIQAQLFF
jgi:hypothetical protein